MKASCIGGCRRDIWLRTQLPGMSVLVPKVKISPPKESTDTTNDYGLLVLLSCVMHIDQDMPSLYYFHHEAQGATKGKGNKVPRSSFLVLFLNVLLLLPS